MFPVVQQEEEAPPLVAEAETPADEAPAEEVEAPADDVPEEGDAPAEEEQAGGGIGGQRAARGHDG